MSDKPGRSPDPPKPPGSAAPAKPPGQAAPGPASTSAKPPPIPPAAGAAAGKPAATGRPPGVPVTSARAHEAHGEVRVPPPPPAQAKPPPGESRPADPKAAATKPPADPRGTAAKPPADPKGTAAKPPADPKGTATKPPADPKGTAAKPPADPKGTATKPPADPKGTAGRKSAGAPKGAAGPRGHDGADLPGLTGDAASDRPRRRRRTAFAVGGGALLVLAGAAAVMGWLNSRHYYLVCGAESITPERGSRLPWGRTPLEGKAWAPIAIPPAANCATVEMSSRDELATRFVAAILTQASHRLTSEKKDDVDQAEKELVQALILTRGPDRHKLRVKVERLQGDVDYWRAAAQVDAALADLNAAAVKFKRAAARDAKRSGDAAAWANFSRAISAQLREGPPSARAHPRRGAAGNTPPFAGTGNLPAPAQTAPSAAAALPDAQAATAAAPQKSSSSAGAAASGDAGARGDAAGAGAGTADAAASAPRASGSGSRPPRAVALPPRAKTAPSLPPDAGIPRGGVLL